MSHTNIQHLIDEHNKEKAEKLQLNGQSSISYSKEGEPVEIAPERKSQPEMEMTETEPSVEDQEVKKFVKIEQQHKIELDPSLKKAGLSAIDTTSLDIKHRIQLPIPDEKVVEGLEKPITSSWRWLSEIAMYMLHRGHLTMKKIHGHVVRVMIK
ncbi:hypothetical protein BH09PAT2_BH09PAT2_00880 [soil metagenome]